MHEDLRNREGERLDATWTSGAEDAAAVVLVGHGVTSHKERPWQVELCDAFAREGIPSLRFTFAGNLGSEGDFTHATLTKEVADLGSVIDCVERARPGARILYAGHSMGAAIGVLRAACDDRLAGLVSLAGMVHVDAFMQRVFGHLRPGEFMLDKPHCPLGAPLLENARQIGDVLDAAARVAVPWLLVHGTADELVPFQDALDARDASGRHAELVALEGADHRFTGRIAAMSDAVVSWALRRGSM